MKIYYDLHIHTGLSPCADKDMSPNNIVNMALLSGLDCIAVTDHNSCGNMAPVMAVSKGTGLIVIPGIEVETSEEVHVLCLFPDARRCRAFGEAVASRLLMVPNKPEIFGRQVYYNEKDEIVGECPNLLLVPTRIDLYELAALARKWGGVMIPAHIDRASNSVLSNLGSMPGDLDVQVVELTKGVDMAGYLAENKRFFSREYGVIQSSDAHCLTRIANRKRFIEFVARPDAEGVVEKLRAGARSRSWASG